uniref:C-type lectin domain-containing protein n=1 Tax=Panagrolaimus superbus TaxID=310955 RepID=A0A914YUJ2_9BILA
MIWSQAEHYCWSNFSAHLASIHNFEEMQFLLEFAYISNSNIWSGAYSENGGKTWQWRDGTRWDYNPWAEGYPLLGTPCGALTDERLINVDCNLMKRTLCKYYL